MEELKIKKELSDFEKDKIDMEVALLVKEYVNENDTSKIIGYINEIIKEANNEKLMKVIAEINLGLIEVYKREEDKKENRMSCTNVFAGVVDFSKIM